MDDLITWLRAQLDDDERKANSWHKVRPDAQPISSRHHHDYVEVSVAGGPWREMSEAEYVETFTVPNPDQRLLREVEAKRRILAEHRDDGGKCDVCADPPQYDATWRPYPCETIRLLALPYSDQPGYRDEWRAS